LSRKKVGVYIDEGIWTGFKRLAFSKRDNFHGSLSDELEAALSAWLEQHAQEHTNNMLCNPQPKIFSVWNQIKVYLREYFDYVSFPQGQRIPKTHFDRAIGLTRGNDPRTIRKWLRTLEQFKLVKSVSNAAYEIVDDTEGVLEAS